MPDLLQEVLTANLAFDLSPKSDRSILRLKSWTQNPATPRAVWEGRELPTKVGQVLDGDTRVLCTGPADWLLVMPPTNVARLRNVAAPELTSQGLALVDLTGGLKILEVRGVGAWEVLRKACGLDLDPQCFGARQCARTRCANIPVVIECIQAGDLFELYVARSHGAYLESWLEDAAG